MKKISFLLILLSCSLYAQELPLPGQTWMPAIPAKQGPFFQKVKPLIAQEPQKVLEMIEQEEKKKHEVQFSPAFDYIRATILYRQDKLELADKAFEQALAKLPSYIDALRARSIIALRQKKNDLALKHFQRLLTLGAADANDLRNIAWLYDQKGHYRAAEEVYRQLLIRDPEMPQLKRAIAANYIQQKRFAEALIILEEELTLKPKDADLWQQVIAISRQVDIEKTLMLLQKARLAEKISSTNKILLAQLLHRKQMLAEAGFIYQECFNDKNLSNNDRLNCLESLMSTTKVIASEKLIIATEDLDATEKARYFALRANYSRLQKDFTKAKEFIEKAMLHDAANPAILFEQAHLQASQEQYDDAIATFESAAQEDFLVRSLLAKASLQSKILRFSAAAETMERVLRIEDNQSYRNYLIQLRQRIQKTSK